jgi:hypothetical protein
MPTYITSIKLLAATDSDVAKLNEVMKSRSFHPKDYLDPRDESSKNSRIYIGTTKANLLDATGEVSTAVSSLGKKFSFTIIRDKTKTES